MRSFFLRQQPCDFNLDVFVGTMDGDPSSLSGNLEKVDRRRVGCTVGDRFDESGQDADLGTGREQEIGGLHLCLLGGAFANP